MIKNNCNSLLIPLNAIDDVIVLSNEMNVYILLQWFMYKYSARNNLGNLIGWSNKPDQHGLTKFVAVPKTA